MKAPNEFWLDLHALSSAYAAEGATPQERADEILAQFVKMPAIARRELLEDFWPLANYLPELYGRVLAAHRSAESKPPVERAG
jgi:hypothetical protein